MISFITRLLRSRPYKVDGESMIPAFNRGDHVLGELLVGQQPELSRGDVVVSERPVISIRPGASGISNRDLKRVIGLPDEFICLRDGLIYINGELLDEPWIAGHRPWEGRGSQWITGPEEYWLLGDNRGCSTDSSSYGPVPHDGVLARIWFRYWPITSWKIF